MIFLWFLLLASFPIYVLPSGMPQPSDWVQVVLVVLVLRDRKLILPREWRRPIAYAIAFAVYTFIVSSIWTLRTADTGFLRASSYYIFNVSLFVMAMHIRAKYGEREFSRATLAGIAFAVALVLGAYVFGGGIPGIRARGTFNNPNQQGYFAVLSTLIMYVCLDRLRSRGFLRFLVIVTGAVLAALSLSRAGILSVLVIAAIHVASSLLRNGKIWETALLACLVAVLWIGVQDTPLVHAVYRRFETKAVTFGDRGYARIVEYPEMVVLGAGEGGHWRFPGIGSHELHSTFGTLLFSYGIPGSVLFLCFLISVARRSRPDHSALLLAPLAYSLGHQGLRVTLFWVSLAVVLSSHQAANSPNDAVRKSG
jgi:hypothetical protein